MLGRWLLKVYNLSLHDFQTTKSQYLYFQNQYLNSCGEIQIFLNQQIRNFSRKSSKSPVGKLPRDQLPVVAITGRPNVGKSSLFNRLLKRRDALVYNTPGSHVTRDYKEGIGHFADLKFKVIDTSGLEPFMPKDSIQFRATRLTEKVINKSDIVILVIDARAGLALLDQHLGQWLQEHSKAPIILIANKCEHYTTDIESTLYESTVLGMGMPIALSAESGLGFSELYRSLRPLIDDIAIQRIQKIKSQEAQSKLQKEKDLLTSQQFLKPGTPVLPPQNFEQAEIEQSETIAYFGENDIIQQSVLEPGEKGLLEGGEEEIGVDEGRRGMMELEMGIEAQLDSYEQKNIDSQIQNYDIQYEQQTQNQYMQYTQQQQQQQYNNLSNKQVQFEKEEFLLGNNQQNSQRIQFGNEQHTLSENQQNPQKLFEQYKKYGQHDQHFKYVQHVDNQSSEKSRQYDEHVQYVQHVDDQSSEKSGQLYGQESGLVVFENDENNQYNQYKNEELQEHMKEIQKEIDQQRQRNIDTQIVRQEIQQQIDQGVQDIKISRSLDWDTHMQKVYEESEDLSDPLMKHFTEVEAEKIKMEEEEEVDEDEEEISDDEEEEEELDEILEEDAEKIHRLLSDGWVDPDAEKEKQTTKQIEEEEGEEAAQKHITLASNYCRIAIMGLPNVGKSTMVNQLIGEERCLTGPEPGLTRDAILTSFQHEDMQIDLIDTAGYMRKSKLDQFDDVGGRVAQLTLFQGTKAMNMAHICIIVIDGYETYVSRNGKPLSAKEIRLVSNVFEEGRGLVIVANKMDLLSSRQRELIRRELKQQVEEQFHQVKGVPVIFTSALTGDGLQHLMPAVVDVFRNWTKRVSTARVNRWMQKLKVTYVGTGMGSGVPKVRYLTQVKARPPSFVVMFKRFRKVGEDDTRHVRNVLREAFGFQGVPVRVYARDNRAEQLRRKFKTYKGRARKNLVQRLKEQKRTYLLKDKETVQELIKKKQEYKRKPWLKKKEGKQQQQEDIAQKQKEDDLKGKHKKKYDKIQRYQKLAKSARS